MRFKYLKYLAFALGGLSTVVATGAVYLYATFDGARLGAEVTHFTKQRHQRTLRFESPPELSMFPRLELRLPRSTLSGRNGEGELLGFERAVVGVRLLPLLARRVVAERVELEGLRLALVRGKDGKLNVADLLAAPVADAPVEFDVDRLDLSHGSLTWTDESAGRKLALSDIELATGRLGRKADGRLELATRVTQAVPAVDARVELQTAYRIDADADQQARNVHLSVKGDLAGRPGVDLDLAFGEALFGGEAPQLAGVSVLAKLKPEGNDETVELRLGAPRLVLSPAGPEAATVEAALRVDGKGHGGQLRAHLAGLRGRGNGLAVDKLTADVDWKSAAGRVAGTLGSPAGWQGDAQVLDLPTLAGELGFTPLRAGAGTIKMAVKAAGRVDFARGNAAGKLDLQADDSRVQGSWTLPHLAPLAVGFDVDVDRLDLDRYLGGEAARRPAPAAGAEAGGDGAIDLSALRGRDIDGVVRVASLQVGGLRLERGRFPLSVHGGKLVSAGYTLNGYGGALDGTLSLDAAGNKLGWRSYLQNANLGPLLRDATGSESAAGIVNFFIDVNGAGATAGELRQGLGGLARLRLRNGVLRGIDVNAALKDWRGAIQARQPARRPYRSGETTSLGEVTASFQIAGGHARSTDLQARSASLGVSGVGDIDLATRHLDWLSRASLLVLPTGPDAALLASLRGVSVPIRAKGPVAGPEWLLEPAALGSPSPVAVVRPAPPPAPRIVAKPVPPRPAPAPRPAAPRPAAPAPAAEGSE